jgi:hypothetical protein
MEGIISTFARYRKDDLIYLTAWHVSLRNLPLFPMLGIHSYEADKILEIILETR